MTHAYSHHETRSVRVHQLILRAVKPMGSWYGAAGGGSANAGDVQSQYLHRRSSVSSLHERLQVSDEVSCG
ncbi:hypothetical protein ZHAS_00003531 [Anopheles sinensis]|uniref:Uncharacterized protein n=1 Tax=Anopheles sinensis TaxID=74873 RepID=A0A084VEH6_ANOSI|nr:hypothetical protein ZHAS_00003531 [Anopheles sinensis]